MKKVYLRNFLILTALLVSTSLITVGCIPVKQPNQSIQPSNQTISPDDAHYAWKEGDIFYLAERETGRQQVLSDEGAYYPFWYEQVGPAMGDVRQRLLYFASESLYLASAPDYQPVTIAEGLNPQGMPVKMRASQ